MGLSTEEHEAVYAQRRLLNEQQKARDRARHRGPGRPPKNEEEVLSETSAAHIDAARDGYYRLTEREAAEQRRVEAAIAEVRKEKLAAPVPECHRRLDEMDTVRRGTYRKNRR